MNVMILALLITLLSSFSSAGAYDGPADYKARAVGVHVADLLIANPDVPGSVAVRLFAAELWIQEKLVERHCTLSWLDGTGFAAHVLKDVRYELGPKDLVVSTDTKKAMVRLPTGDVLTFIYAPALTGVIDTADETFYGDPGTGAWTLHDIYTQITNNAHLTGTILGQVVDSWQHVETLIYYPAIIRTRQHQTYTQTTRPTISVVMPVTGTFVTR